MALEVARRLGKALVAPSIRVGCSEHHMAFPGTISILPETLEALVRDYCVSLSRHGFKNICIIPTHGGNFAPIAVMLDRLREAVGPGTRVFAFTDLEGMMKAWRNAVQKESGLGNRVGGHADIAESSIMMVLHPELVDKNIAEPGFTDPVTPEVLDRMFKEGLQNLTPNGVMGGPPGDVGTDRAQMYRHLCGVDLRFLCRPDQGSYRRFLLNPVIYPLLSSIFKVSDLHN